jgi:hypothetical protein
VVKLAQEVLAQSIAPTTRANYSSAVRHVINFHDRLHTPFKFPVTSDTLCLWMADSVDKLRYTSIRNYLHGVATLQQELGYDNPLHSPLLWRMYKAIKRLQGKQVVRQRLPITVSILSQLSGFVDTNDLQHLCMRAAMWLGTCGLLRAGEFTTKSTTRNVLHLRHLTFYDSKHVEVDPFQHDAWTQVHYMKLRLEQSKTDPFRGGSDVVIGNVHAVSFMLTYLRTRNRQHYILKRMPLLCDTDTGQALSASALVKFTQSLIARANIPNADRFLGHSFRKGGATSLHEAGHPDSLIKLMGRWSSFAFASYVHTPVHMLIEAGKSLSSVQEVEVQAHAVPTTNDSFWDVNNL